MIRSLIGALVGLVALSSGVAQESTRDKKKGPKAATEAGPTKEPGTVTNPTGDLTPTLLGSGQLTKISICT